MRLSALLIVSVIADWVQRVVPPIFSGFGKMPDATHRQIVDSPHFNNLDTSSTVYRHWLLCISIPFVSSYAATLGLIRYL